MTDLEITIRHLLPEDHPLIIAKMPEWWGGRDLTHMVPRLFAVHFQNTSFVAECDGELVGFLIGFMSPSFSDEAYIHFVGVSPARRKGGLARELYSNFFSVAERNGRTKVRCCTSPVNRGSVEFHKKMGFALESGNGEVDGFPVTLNHNKPGDHKIQFFKILESSSV